MRVRKQQWSQTVITDWFKLGKHWAVCFHPAIAVQKLHHANDEAQAGIKASSGRIYQWPEYADTLTMAEKREETQKPLTMK